MDAQRRAEIDRTIAVFRGDTERETMVSLAAEIVRLSRNIAVLKEGIERAGAGEAFVLMPQGPYTKKNKTEEQRRDRSAKWL
jgi:hypothetical protein